MPVSSVGCLGVGSAHVAQGADALTGPAGLWRPSPPRSVYPKDQSRAGRSRVEWAIHDPGI